MPAFFSDTGPILTPGLLGSGVFPKAINPNLGSCPYIQGHCLGGICLFSLSSTQWQAQIQRWTCPDTCFSIMLLSSLYYPFLILDLFKELFRLQGLIPSFLGLSDSQFYCVLT